MKRLLIALILSLYTIVSYGSVDPEFIAAEKAAIKRASNEWATALAGKDPQKVIDLYDDETYLYATFKNKIDDHEGLTNYFSNLMKKKELKVKFDDENVRVYGGTAINSGLYTFIYKDNDKTVKTPARFTFVYTLTPDGWMIIDHHSSQLPE